METDKSFGNMTFSSPRKGNNGEQQGVICDRTKDMNKEKDFVYLVNVLDSSFLSVVFGWLYFYEK